MLAIVNKKIKFPNKINLAMEKSLFLLVLIFSSTLLFITCSPKIFPPSPNEENKKELINKQATPNQVKGGDYPNVKPDLNRKLNEVDEPYIVPNGPQRGKEKPKSRKTQIKKNDSSQQLKYEDYEEINDAVSNGHPILPEPSVAENGMTIMTTGNSWMSLSLDGGQSFSSVNPTTIFPNDYGGFCCDQVLNYVPEYDLFVWLLQYWSSDGINAIRVAVQNTQEVRNSNGTSWTYWDFRNTDLASSGNLDYNDMSFSNNFLYWTSSIGGGGNRYVIRIPLKELQAKGTVNYQFTNSTQAFWSHVTQNGQNGVYWAGHENNSTMKVYSMMESDNFYSWRDVNINSWPNNTISSIAANGKDWLQDASWKTYIRAAAVSGNSIYFAWNASSDSDFPQPHIQIVELYRNNFALKNQMQVWNPDFAFAYPYFEINNQGKIGMITAFGGGTFNSSSGVGVWGDFVIYYPRLSSLSNNNYGHYHTVRRSGSNFSEWVGAGYTYENDGTILPYYVRFSH
jgi:hypothetical protein